MVRVQASKSSSSSDSFTGLSLAALLYTVNTSPRARPLLFMKYLQCIKALLNVSWQNSHHSNWNKADYLKVVVRGLSLLLPSPISQVFCSEDS